MGFVKFNTINALLDYIKDDTYADTAGKDEDCEFIIL